MSTRSLSTSVWRMALTRRFSLVQLLFVDRTDTHGNWWACTNVCRSRLSVRYLIVNAGGVQVSLTSQVFIIRVHISVAVIVREEIEAVVIFLVRLVTRTIYNFLAYLIRAFTNIRAVSAILTLSPLYTLDIEEVVGLTNWYSIACSQFDSLDWIWVNSLCILVDLCTLTTLHGCLALDI